jgi:hypothetical protein
VHPILCIPADSLNMKLSQNNLLAQSSVFAIATTGQAALEPRFKSSTYLSMRVEDPVADGTGQNSAPRSCPADLRREILNQNLNFEMASSHENFQTGRSDRLPQPASAGLERSKHSA